MKTKQLLLILLAAFLPSATWAGFWYDPETPNVYYEYTEGNSEASARGDHMSSGAVTIRSSFTVDGNEYTVTSIKDYAFNLAYGLTSITIPNTIKTIGESAFSGCSKLASITMSNSVTSIGDGAFYACALKEVTIPKSVTQIGYSAFSGCSQLKAVHITDIAAWCSVKIFVGGNPLEYAHHLYLNDAEVTDLVIPEGVVSIGDYAFEGGSYLTSVTIPATLTSIGEDAFAGCTSLKAVHLTDVGAWCNMTFGDNPLSKAQHLYMNGEEVTDLVIPEGVTIVTGFYNCINLKSVTFPSTATTIGGFARCTGLTSLTIPEGVTTIADYAFNECEGLTSVTIPSTLTSSGQSAFYYCINIEEVHITDLAAWCGIEFDAYWGNPCRSRSHLYLNGEEIIDLVVPDGVTSIGNCAFQNFSNLTSVSIPNSVTSIGEYAFSSCKNLTSLTIPSSVTNINKFAFGDCSGLTTLTLSEGLTTIGHGAFIRCSGLTSIEIPSSVTSIDEYAFINCTSLSNVTSLIQEPFAIVGVFSDDVYENAILYVPFGTKESYMNTEGWNNFYNIVTIGGVQIAINETNFPDENFRNYLLEQSYGEDGVLTENEISQITSISVNNKEISSLTGIEYFTALKELSCSSNQLTALDVSKNTALKTLYCHENQLTALDLSKNTALKELYCSNNQLTALDVTNCNALKTLYCHENQLTALDLSKNTALTTLWCESNQLTALNVSGSTALTELKCGNNQLTALDLSGSTALTKLNCGINQLTALDLSGNTALKELDCYENRIKGGAMDALISSLPEITGEKAPFHVIYNTSWSTDGNVCTKEQVAAALARGWQPMENKNWNWEPYEGSDGSDPQVGTDIAIDETNFPDENFRNYLLAQYYGADGVLTGNEIKNVFYISVYNKEISSLKGIEHFTALTSLNCYNNQLTALDVSKNTALDYLSCSSNQLTSLDVSGNTALTSLSCSSNQLTTLDVSNNTALDYLYCSYNQLTALDVSKNTSLETLGCDNNQLTALNVTNCNALEKLDCSSNQLTTLDLSKNTALKELDCSKNQINGAAMDALINSLPEKTGDKAAFHVIYNNWQGTDGNDCTKEQVAAALAKGWQPMENIDWNWVPYEGSGEPVAINETNFPDENFRNYLLAQSYGKDGVLTGNEINNLTYISVDNKEISSLKGIEHFTALTSLNCSNNQLTALDVSKNTALKGLDCYSNQIKGAAMDALISSLPTITGEKAPFHVVYYRSWAAEGNECTKEQVAAALAKGWQPMENIDWNWVPYEGSIEPVDINEANFPDENFRNYLLEQSYGTDGVLTYNEIRGVTKIEIYSKEISSLKGIELFTSLESLSCSGNQLTALDVSKNTALRSLYCDNNQLTALDISNNTALRSLSCDNNQLTALDLSKNTALYSLYCNNNQLTALDVSNNTSLESLSCSGNQLTALDVSKNTVLRGLYCDNNQLTALDVSKNTALRYLYCYSNQIKGAAMDALISSLPDKTGENSVFRVIYNDEETIEGNECTKEQVAAAIAKGWEPMEYKDEEWVPYEGSDVTVQINTATINRGSQPVYTLSGQRVTAPKKGINIVGGKKVVVK